MKQTSYNITGNRNKVSKNAEGRVKSKTSYVHTQRGWLLDMEGEGCLPPRLIS